ncbi:MAG: NUDIX domain-containing protein [Conexivisphaerales archaeon]
MQLYPEPTVGALIQRKDGKVLLCISHKWPGLYTVPGGHVELGETLEDAIKREVKEEVGLGITPVELISVQQVIYPPEFWKKGHFIFFDYLCETKNEEELKLDKREIQDAVWVTLNDALSMKIDKYLMHFIKRTIDRSLPFLVMWRDR